MQIFLTVYSKQNIPTESLEIEKKAGKLLNHYQQFVKNRLNRFVYSNNGIVLIYITDKPLETNSHFLHNSTETICFSTGTPTGLNKLFSDFGMSNNDEHCLLKLKTLFNSHGQHLIERISPPFIFGFIDNGHLHIIHDGLGFEQGFVYENDDFWMCSNKCYPIVYFSDDVFEINDDGWRHYFQSGWFHQNHTPLKKIKALGMGEAWICKGGKVQKQRFDCFNHWLKPLDMNTLDVMEILRSSFNETVKELVTRYCRNPVTADLSGGRDTRMILSSLIHCNIGCQFNTVGEPFSADVGTVKTIQKYYPIEVQYINPQLVQFSKVDLEEKIRRTILWQDGFGEIKSSKYMSLLPQEVASTPKFAGLVGGFYKAGGYPRPAFERSAKQRVKAFLKSILGKKKKSARDFDCYLENKKRVLQQGKRYSLKGYLLHDYYSFTGKGRRWSSACASNPLNGTLLPFLDYSSIRSSFSIPPKDKIAHKIHDYVIQKNAHKLSKIPYDHEIPSNPRSTNKLPFDENIFWRLDTASTIMDDIIKSDHYIWKILDQTAITSMWEEHKCGNLKIGDYLWKIAGFYYWHERFQKHIN